MNHAPSLAARAASFFLCKTFRFAIAAATASGDAECVEVIEPGAYKSSTAERPITADSGSDDVMPLPQAMRSGLMP